jgi:hypothetical protein
MTSLNVSRHAVVRLAQRSLSVEDVDFIMMIGTEVEDGFVVLDRDVNALGAELRSCLQRIERLKGKRLVIEGNRLITAYRAKAATERRLLRSAPERDVSQGKQAPTGREK